LQHSQHFQIEGCH